MKKYLIVLAVAAITGGHALAANNTGGAAGLNQKPDLPPTTNPQAPSSPGPVGGTPAPDFGPRTAGGVNPVPAPPPRKGLSSNPTTELQRSTATEISFSTGNNVLTPEAQLRLDQLMVSAHRRGQIEEVKVVSWGDIAYPASGARKAPKGQKDLAHNRNTAVEKYLQERNNGIAVTKYNMAERPSAMQDLLKTAQDRTKTSLESAGVAGAEGNKRGSRAVVMVILK